MVSWIYDGTNTVQQDLYSTGETDPDVLSANAYTTTVTTTAAMAFF